MIFIGRKKFPRIVITVAFAFILILSLNTMLLTNGNYISNNYVYGQANQTSIEVSSQSDIFQIPIQKVKVGDIEMAYKTFGNGTNTILLISGGSNTMDFWDPHFLNELAKDNIVIVFDSRGIGNTTSGDKPFSIKQFANDTAGMLDAIGISNKADVLGFSLGSLIAQELTYMHPDKVNRLILYASFCGGSNFVPPAPILQNFTDALQDPRMENISDSIGIYKVLDDILFPTKWMQENPGYLDRLPREGVSIDSSDATKLLRAFMNWVQTESCNKLSDIKVPTLVIVGTDDSVTLPRNSINLAEGIPGAWLIQIKGGGHGLMFQSPDIFTKSIQLFLTQ